MEGEVRELFKKYIRHVGWNEGTYFLTFRSSLWTDDEWDTLQALVAEIDLEDKK